MWMTSGSGHRPDSDRRLVWRHAGPRCLRWALSLLSLCALAPTAVVAGTDIHETFAKSASVIAYNPPSLGPTARQDLAPVVDVVRDLRLLRTSGFDGLVTYSANGVLGKAPQLARQQGFTGMVVMGIWDPSSADEWRNALAQAAFVDGYCVGNEGLGVRYNVLELGQRMAELRRLTGRPVTTSEPVQHYFKGRYKTWLRKHSDWLFPIAHPYWADQVNPASAVDWISVQHDLLVAESGRPVMLKEGGVPTAGMVGYSEQAQNQFFALLRRSRVAFVYFEAFDQPWKGDARRHEAEAHWGLFRADGTPKAVVATFQSGATAK